MAIEEWRALLLRAAGNRVRGASRRRRCVILVDGDAVPPRLAGVLIAYAASLGRVTSFEVFANFASTNANGWSAQMQEHGIVGFQHYQTSNGKNGADTSLIVRAMDLLHTERPEHYVLVSMDSDFSALAHRVRRSGASVHGVGYDSAAAALRASCTTFVTFRELSTLLGSSDAEVGPRGWKRAPEDAEDRLLLALVKLGGAREWIRLSDLGQELRSFSPTFEPRFFGARTLRELCAAIDSIELENAGSEPLVRVALRTGNGSASSGTARS